MIFLDNASTTKIYEEALKVYNDFSVSNFFNASSAYKEGVKVNSLINDVRSNLIKLLGGNVFDNLIFTASATEANNLAIMGIVRKNFGKLLFSSVEHSSVFNVANNLKNLGYNVEFIKVLENGLIDEDDFSIKVKDASFVSIMHVNNETGAINDIKKLVKIAKNANNKIIFHCDGVQAFGKIKVNCCALGVDLYTISAHKIHGPKGIGALYVKNGINLKPIILGGGQEFNLRSGTENTPAIMAFNKAAQISCQSIEKNLETVILLKTCFIKEITNSSLKVNIIANSESSSPYIVCISIPNVKSETILHMAESEGVLLSNGSACSSKHADNRVLKAMGLNSEISGSSIRVSFSFDTKLDEVVSAAQIIKNKCENYIKTLN